MRDYGDKVAEEIDEEVKILINQAYTNAVDLLEEHKPKLVRLAEYLIENETVSGASLDGLFDEGGAAPQPVTPPEPEPEAPPYAAPAPRPQPTIQPAPTLSSTDA